jgi:hypothetical protein
MPVHMKAIVVPAAYAASSRKSLVGRLPVRTEAHQVENLADCARRDPERLSSFTKPHRPGWRGVVAVDRFVPSLLSQQRFWRLCYGKDALAPVKAARIASGRFVSPDAV